MDFLYILSWWFLMQLFGLAALPIAHRIFRWLPDRGYAFSKPIGLLLVSYLLWLGGMTGLLGNNVGGVLLALLIVGGCSAWLFWRGETSTQDDSDRLTSFLRQNKPLILTVEALFLIAFAAWAGVRAFAVDKIMPQGGEKFMEIAFLNGILNSPRFPPLDVWMSGFSISYYYFGYVMMAVVTRLSGLPASVGFDLYDALLFALTAVGAFGVVYNLIPRGKRKTDGQPNPRQAISFGLVAASFTVLLGNLEGLLEALHSARMLPPSLLNWVNIQNLASAPTTGTFYPGTASGWWWWRASRIVWDRDLLFNPLNDTNITEFPFFSFLLGDNHPHVLNLPFVLLAIGLALNLLRATLERHPAPLPENADNPPQSNAREWWNPLSAFDGHWPTFLFYAFCLGALGFLNTWDFPIYVGLVALAHAVALYALEKQVTRHLVGRAVSLTLGLMAGGVLFFVFFYVGFRSQAGGILPYVFPPTTLAHYLVMFGPFVFITAAFLGVNLLRHVRQYGSTAAKKTLAWWLWVVLACLGTFSIVLISVPLVGFIREVVLKAMSDPAVQQALGGLSLSDAILAVLQSRLRGPWVFLLLSAMLTLAVSTVFWHSHSTVTDAAEEKGAKRSPSILFVSLLIFLGLALTLSVEFVYLRDVFGNRMNTVFKFYYQAWVMLALASAYALWWIVNRSERVIGALGRWLLIGGALALIAAGMVYPLMAVVSRTNGFSGQATLDGAANIARDNPDDWAAIQWLRQNATAGGSAATYRLPVILEAPAGSYQYEGRISAFSGLPALLGWAGHELQWRGNYQEQSLREPDILIIYTTYDAQEALALLRKWHVNYVIVGAAEMNYIQKQCESSNRVCSLTTATRKFPLILTPVFSQGQTTIYQVP